MIKFGYCAIIIGSIVMITVALTTFGFLSSEAFARSYIPTVSSPDVILLPFGKSTMVPHLFLPDIHSPFPKYHGTIPFNQQPSPTTATSTVSDLEQCTSAISNMINGFEANYGLTSDQVTFLGGANMRQLSLIQS